MSQVRKKVVVVGDGNCGKTCMLLILKSEPFLEDHVPTVCNDYVHSLRMDGKTVHLTLIDTAGQADYDNLRQMAYPDTDVVIAVYSIAEPDSLDNITLKWVPEVRHHLPDVPIVLVGNKSDLRHDKATIDRLRRTQRSPVTMEKGVEVAHKIRAFQGLECSAKNKDTKDVEEVFKVATKAALQYKKTRKGCFII